MTEEERDIGRKVYADTGKLAYRIENGVPIPDITPLGRHTKYPFAALEVGEYLTIDVDSVMRGNAVMTAAHKFCEYHRIHNTEYAGRTLVTRRVNDGKAVRVWRLK